MAHREHLGDQVVAVRGAVAAADRHAVQLGIGFGHDLLGFGHDLDHPRAFHRGEALQPERRQQDLVREIA